MNERLRRRCDVREGVDVRHHIVTEATFVSGDRLEVDVLKVRTHLREGFLREIESELALRFGQRQPQLTPQAISRPRRPELEHRPRRIAFGERRRVRVVAAHRITKSVLYTRPPRSKNMRIGPRLPKMSIARAASSALAIG